MTLEEFRTKKERERVWRTEQTLLASGFFMCRNCGTWINKEEVENNKCKQCRR